MKRAYSLVRAFSAKTLNFAIAVNLVVFEDGQLRLLALVLDLLGSGVDLLLPLLTTPTETEDEVKCGFLKLRMSYKLTNIQTTHLMIEVTF